MRTLLPLLILTAALNSTTFAADADSGKWIQLFNGKSLEGWTPKIRYSDCGENYGTRFASKTS